MRLFVAISLLSLTALNLQAMEEQPSSPLEATSKESKYIGFPTEYIHSNVAKQMERYYKIYQRFVSRTRNARTDVAIPGLFSILNNGFALTWQYAQVNLDSNGEKLNQVKALLEKLYRECVAKSIDQEISINLFYNVFNELGIIIDDLSNNIVGFDKDYTRIGQSASPIPLPMIILSNPRIFNKQGEIKPEAITLIGYDHFINTYFQFKGNAQIIQFEPNSRKIFDHYTKNTKKEGTKYRPHYGTYKDVGSFFFHDVQHFVLNNKLSSELKRDFGLILFDEVQKIDNLIDHLERENRTKQGKIKEKLQNQIAILKNALFLLIQESGDIFLLSAKYLRNSEISCLWLLIEGKEESKRNIITPSPPQEDQGNLKGMRRLMQMHTFKKNPNYDIYALIYSMKKIFERWFDDISINLPPAYQETYKKSIRDYLRIFYRIEKKDKQIKFLPLFDSSGQEFLRLESEEKNEGENHVDVDQGAIAKQREKILKLKDAFSRFFDTLKNILKENDV